MWHPVVASSVERSVVEHLALVKSKLSAAAWAMLHNSTQLMTIFQPGFRSCYWVVSFLCFSQSLLPAEATAVLFSASSNFVNTITHEPLHSAWCNLCTDTLWKPIEYQGHRSKVKVTCFLCVSCMHDTAWTSWPGFTKCRSLDRN